VEWDRGAIGRPDAEIARSINVSTNKLGNWKRGDNYPDPHIVPRLCDRYGATMDWIFRGLLYGMPTELADRIVQMQRAE
jgi:transcriptional regulator with XRE-family HTH domain